MNQTEVIQDLEVLTLNINLYGKQTKTNIHKFANMWL